MGTGANNTRLVQKYINNVKKMFSNKTFAGAARRAGPDSMLILGLCVCVSEIISWPLTGR